MVMACKGKRLVRGKIFFSMTKIVRAFFFARGIHGFSRLSLRRSSLIPQSCYIAVQNRRFSALKNSGDVGERDNDAIYDYQKTKYAPQFDHIDLNIPFYPIYYNDVYEVSLPPNHRFPMAKYGKVRKIVQQNVNALPDAQRRLVQCEFRVSPLATVDDLITTHCPDYVNRYLRGDQTDIELRNVGFPWSTSGVNRTLSSVGGTVAAAISICEIKRRQIEKVRGRVNGDEVTLAPVWSSHVAGGTHHAFANRGEGFCVFSDIAVATNVVLERFSDVVNRVLILDLDVHQGNGNAVLFKGRNDVLTFSMHCSSNYFSKKEDSDLDIELPANCTDETYLSTLQYWLKRMKNEAGKFDLIFFQAGVDVLEDDRLGRMSLTQLGVQKRNRMVFDFAHEQGIPLCITMGGGYPKKDWTPILNAHANVYFQAHQYLCKNNNISITL